MWLATLLTLVAAVVTTNADASTTTSPVPTHSASQTVVPSNPSTTPFIVDLSALYPTGGSSDALPTSTMPYNLTWTNYSGGQVLLSLTEFKYHLLLNESCDNQGNKSATAHFVSLDWHIDMDLPLGERYNVTIPIRNFPPLRVGPYVYEESKLLFAFYSSKDCLWDSDLNTTACGSCTPDNNWTTAPLNCKSNSTATRYHNAECTFSLGRDYNATVVPAQSDPDNPDDSEDSSLTTPAPTPTKTPEIHLVGTNTRASAAVTSVSGSWELDFNLTLTEECTADDNVKVKGLYSNGNILFHIDLGEDGGEDETLLLNNTGGIYQPINMTYNYSQSKITFVYREDEVGESDMCTWDNGFVTPNCGSCHATPWTSDVLKCDAHPMNNTMTPSFGTDNGRSRNQDLQCKYVLKKFVPTTSASASASASVSATATATATTNVRATASASITATATATVTVTATATKTVA